MEITTTGKQASIIGVIHVDPFGLNNLYRVFEMKNIDNSPLDLMAGIHSTPARRYLSDKKIPEKIIWSILDAAIRGPSGGNSQMWSWIVIRNQDTKNKIAKWYLEGWNKSYGTKREQFVSDIDAKNNLGRKNFLSAEHLANNIQDAPVWVFAVLRNTNICRVSKSAMLLHPAKLLSSDSSSKV